MVKKLQALKKKKGFTLVELIVVIAIIGVLAAILIPTMMGYVTSANVTSKNSTAASIKNSIGTFLTEADTQGYGMLKGASNQATFSIAISNGSWTCTVSTDPTGSACFKKPAMWPAAGGTGKAADNKVNAASNACQLLAITLADLFPTVDQGFVWAYCEGGTCMYVSYTEDTASAPGAGVLPSAANFAAGSFAWDNSTAGITSTGLTVGTAPALPLGTGSST